MKLKIKLSLMVVAILVAVVAGISMLMLSHASEISIDLNKRVIEVLSGREAQFWKGRQDKRFSMLNTLENVFSDYLELEPETRRDRFDVMLKGLVTSNPELLQVYTVWLPNAIDDMDEQMIGREGSTETGQYAMTYSREGGQVFARTSTDVAGTMAYLSRLNANNLRDRVEPPVSKVIDGKDTYVIRMMKPIVCSSTKRIVGAVGYLMTINQMQPILEQTIEANEEIAAMAIYANDGSILAHSYSDRIGKNMSDTEGFLGDDLPNAIRAVTSGEVFHASSASKAMGTTLETFFSPLRIGNSDSYWSVMIAAREDFILSEVNDLRNFTIALAAIVVLAVAVTVYFVLHFTMKPIVNVALTLKDIAQGEGDLTVTIPEKGNNEITDLSRYFNQTLSKIKNLVMGIKQQTVVLSNIGNNLSTNMTETAAAINQITSNIQSIKGRIINQSASVTETNATMEQMTVNINKLSNHVERQTVSVSQSSSAIEEMLANIHSVTQTLVNNEGNVNDLTGASEVGRSGLQEVVTDIQEISRDSEGLLEINSVMQTIASQTNLLSMNAAIEAAHAGEAGKGFAVVADEIRKLAESSGEQSKTTSAVLKKIKGSIDKISKSTDAVLQKFEAIDSGVKIVADQEMHIRNSMEEQGQGSKQILDAIGNLNGVTREVKDGSHEMLEGSNEVIRESKNLEKATIEITGGMNEMASGADQINAAVHAVNELCSNNRQSIDLLAKEISRFKVE